jgi:L-asparaginase II
MPLAVLAQTFARLVTGEGVAPERRRAIERILDACWQNPDLVAGRGRADTVVMRNFPRQIFMKTGAEGVYCGAFPEFGLGFALKIDDGAKRASSGAAIALVERIYPGARGLMPYGVLKTWRGAEVGTIRTAPALQSALDALKV